MAVMGIMRHSIIFGGIDSADYGIYIGGEGTFNAPARQVEMVEVPGRNGAIAVDQGRWENITVTYSAFNYEEDLETFAQQLSDFRNAICSQIGYQRLSDTFHPDEYRMAICSDPLEIKPIDYNTASQFEIKFNCKPQRWLTSGETAVPVSSGDTLTNPTQYASGPLLAVKGSGEIAFNGFEIEVIDQYIGTVQIADNLSKTGGSTTDGVSCGAVVASSLFNDGDEVTVLSGTYVIKTSLPKTYHASIVSESGALTGVTISGTKNYEVTIPTITIPFASDSNPIEGFYDLRFARKDGTGSTYTGRIQITASTFISAGKRYVYFSARFFSHTGITVTSQELTINNVSGYSTVSVLGNPTYIDCEIGEAYRYIDDEVVPLNGLINFGSDLPTLASGENTITFDDTITELAITPRWWKL